MRIWHCGVEDVTQLYNNKAYVIKVGSITEMGDDLAAFLLNKENLRGEGLVQLKDGDSKEDRYKQARKQIFDWATKKWGDYQKHCEERELQNMKALPPHKEIFKWKNRIDEYEKWVIDGERIPEELKETIGEKEKIFVCPNCSKEFLNRVAYFGHMRSHQKGENEHISAVNDEGKG